MRRSSPKRHGVLSPSATLNPRSIIHIVDREYWADAAGYAALHALPSGAKLPRGSDAAEALRVFKKWADVADARVLAMPSGKIIYAVMWSSGAGGGLELFGPKGERIASQGWAEGGPRQAWVTGAQSRWLDAARKPRS